MPKTGPFDRHADSYDQWFEENSLAYRSEVAAVRSLLPPGDGVEIGVGTGRFAPELDIPSGVEPSTAMRAKALAAGVDVVDGVAEALPYPDASAGELFNKPSSLGMAGCQTPIEGGVRAHEEVTGGPSGGSKSGSCAHARVVGQSSIQSTLS